MCMSNAERLAVVLNAVGRNKRLVIVWHHSTVQTEASSYVILTLISAQVFAHKH
jgi:hypothetical protein